MQRHITTAPVNKYLTAYMSVSGCGVTEAVEDVTWWTKFGSAFHHGRLSAKWKILKVARNQMTLHVIPNHYGLTNHCQYK